MTFILERDSLFGDFAAVVTDVETRLCSTCTADGCVALLKLAAGIPVLVWDVDDDGVVSCSARRVEP